MNENNIEMEIADAIMERPIGFEVKGRHFYIYPPSLGKSYLNSRLIATLNLDKKGLNTNPFMTALMAIKKDSKTCCRLLVYATLNTKEDVFNEELVEERTNFFGENLDLDEMTQLFMLILLSDRSAEFMKHLMLDKEKERMKKVQDAKKSNNTFIFCGKSEYGTLIDYACERYGWSFQYVVWGISLTNLQMMMNDSVKSIYLTDEERKRVHISNDNTVIKADTKDAWDIINKINWD